MSAANPRQHFGVRFDQKGVVVSSGGDTLGLRAASVGRGATLQPLGALTPSARANRIVYRGARGSEWYANGPLGLEQGFSLSQRPAGASHAPAVVAMSVSGGLRPELERGSEGVVFKRPDGRSVLRYGQLSVSDARGRAVPARLGLAAGEVRITISDRGARYPLNVDPTISQVAKLTASDGAAGDQLGYSMAISGSTIAVGTQEDTTAGNTGPGAVYVFTKPASGGWQNATQTAKLTASDGATGDRLGTSVAISGSTIVAGAPYANIGSVLGKGAVYVFTEPAGGWQNATQTAKLTASDGGQGDELGHSVGISGSTIVAGAIITHAHAGGALYVFSEPAGGWQDGTQTAYLTASDGVNGDYLGWSVAISGSEIVAGASHATVGGNTVRGAVYEFSEPSGGWQNATQTAKLTASDGAANDELGYAVAVSGSTIVSGTPYAPFAGAVYVFTEPAGGWQDGTQAAHLTASDGTNGGDALGSSVAISGSTIVAGSKNDYTVGSQATGAAYLYTEPAGGWQDGTESAKFVASGAAYGDQVGYSVAISGGTVFVGAPQTTVGSNGAQGAVYVFAQPGVPAGGSTVVASATSVQAGNGAAQITVTLKDDAGNPLAGKTVTLTQSGGNSVILPVVAGSNVTDQNGVATFTVSDATAEGPITYTAADSTDGMLVAQTAQVTFTAPPSSGSTSTSTGTTSTGTTSTGTTSSGTTSSGGGGIFGWFSSAVSSVASAIQHFGSQVVAGIPSILGNNAKQQATTIGSALDFAIIPSGKLIEDSSGHLVAIVKPDGQVVAAGAGNLVRIGPDNVVAAGGGNWEIKDAADHVVAAGGGNLVTPSDNFVLADAAGHVVAAGGGNIIGNASGNLIGNASGNLIGNASGNFGTDTGALVSGVSNVVAAGGGNLIPVDAGQLQSIVSTVVAAGAGNLRVGLTTGTGVGMARATSARKQRGRTPAAPLLAQAKVVFSGPGSQQLVLKLTPAGQRTISRLAKLNGARKRRHQRPLSLRVRLTESMTQHGKTVTVARSFMVQPGTRAM